VASSPFLPLDQAWFPDQREFFHGDQLRLHMGRVRCKQRWQSAGP
jgi:hypothetical protein